MTVTQARTGCGIIVTDRHSCNGFAAVTGVPIPGSCSAA